VGDAAGAPPVRLGVVGCGFISERHARAAAATPAVELVACCDVRPGAADAWRRRYGCERAFDDYRAMVHEADLDAVLLATWPNLHREQVLGCLEAGIASILCEKSLAQSAHEALEIWTAAREAGALVVEAFMYRHHPAIAKIDELVGAGAVGAVDSVSAAFSLFDPEESAPDDPGRDWRQRGECGGGVPWDLACYCVDACNRFARTPPREAFAVLGRSERYGTVDRLFGVIEYEDGLVGTLESSKRSNWNHELRLSGAFATVRLPLAWRIDGPSEVVVSRSSGWSEHETERFAIPAADAYALQLDRFAAAVRGQAAPIPSLAESVATAFALDALLSSGAEHSAVPVELPAAVRSELAPSGAGVAP
jgi:D-xylose 1-dehydrogenase (NADP+, D-xylono-1,5-lactone-forming)